jgi:lipopolysaccharide export system permease protein
MRIFDRYVLSAFFRVFFLAGAAFLSVFLIVDIFENTDMMIRNQATLLLAVRYFLYRMPMNLLLVIPVCVLLSSLLTFSVLSRNNEVMAMKAGGVNLHRAALPIILTGAFAAAFSFLLNEQIVPASNKRARIIEDVELKHKEISSIFKREGIWLKGERSFIHINTYIPEAKLLRFVSVLEVGNDYSIARRVDAEEARWNGSAWTLHNAYVRLFSPDGGISVEFEREMPFPLSKSPEDLSALKFDTMEMTYKELKEFARRIEAEGYDASRYYADLHAKLSFPLVNIIMTLIAIPFSLKSGRRGGFAVSLGLCLVIGFSFWIIFAFAVSLGHSGILNPYAAAWGVVTAFTVLGAILMLKVER